MHGCLLLVTQVSAKLLPPQRPFLTTLSKERPPSCHSPNSLYSMYFSFTWHFPPPDIFVSLLSSSLSEGKYLFPVVSPCSVQTLAHKLLQKSFVGRDMIKCFKEVTKFSKPTHQGTTATVPYLLTWKQALGGFVTGPRVPQHFWKIL